MVILPVLSQEMVIINIHYNPGIMMVIGMQPFCALPEYRVGISISVYGTVKQDAFLHIGRKLLRLSMDAVGHKVAYFHQVVIARKVYVRKEVHRHNLAISF